MNNDLMAQAMTVATFGVAALLVYAALFDLRTYRIPNAVSLATLVMGMIMASLRATEEGGLTGLLADLAISLLVFRVLYLFWLAPELRSMSKAEALRAGPDAWALKIVHAVLTVVRSHLRTITTLAITSVAVTIGRPLPVPAPVQETSGEAGSFLGGGDVKLLSAAALVVGADNVVTMLLITAIAGGVLVCLFSLRNLLIRAMARRGLIPAPTALRHVAYGPAIAAGALFALLAPAVIG